MAWKVTNAQLLSRRCVDWTKVSQLATGVFGGCSIKNRDLHESIIQLQSSQNSDRSVAWNSSFWVLCWPLSNLLIRFSPSCTWARKLKKSKAKKLVKSNLITFTKKFLTEFHFLRFQKWPKINFWTGKTTKKCNFTKIIFWLIWFHEFFCLDFFKFSGPLWINYYFFC